MSVIRSTDSAYDSAYDDRRHGIRDPLVVMLVEEIGLAAPGMCPQALLELKRLRKLGVEMDKDTVLWVIENAGRRFDEKIERQRKHEDELLRKSVVYYMRVGNRVKIGTTRDLQRRLATLMPEELLTTEPGDVRVERERHRQFADLHVSGEWFRQEEPLVSHVEELRRHAQLEEVDKTL